MKIGNEASNVDIAFNNFIELFLYYLDASIPAKYKITYRKKHHPYI